MTERWLQGNYVELTYALRVFAKRSTMSANLETIIENIHDIARDPQPYVLLSNGKRARCETAITQHGHLLS